MAHKRKYKRDKLGRFLSNNPIGNLSMGNHVLVKKSKPEATSTKLVKKADDEYEYHEVTEIPRHTTFSPLVKNLMYVGAGLGIFGLIYVGSQMLDIQENIQVKMAGIKNARMVGITAFGFTLNVKLINTTKSSMEMSYPIITLIVKRAAINGKPYKEMQITQSSTKSNTVKINANSETPLSFDFEISFFPLLSIITMVNPFTLFSNILDEISTPTGKNGKPNFKPILSGTGLSFWADTQIYAGNALKTHMLQQIF